MKSNTINLEYKNPSAAPGPDKSGKYDWSPDAVVSSLRNEFSGQCQVQSGSSYHDYFTLQMARLSPDKVTAEQTIFAVKRILGSWHRISVSVRPDQNLVIVLCYKHNLIATS